VDVRLVLTGDYGGQEYVVDGNEFVIGRELSCHLRLDYAKISLRHCRITKRGGRLFAEDLNSTNGTAVNDQTLGTESVELHDGDLLRVGPVIYRVDVGSSGDSGERAGKLVAVASGARAGVLIPPGLSDSGTRTSPAVESAKQLLDMLGLQAGKEESASGRSDSIGAGGGKRHWVEVSETEGVAVVRVVPPSVVDDRAVRRIAEELTHLIDAGKSRITLNLANVENLSSQAVGAVIQAHRRCQAGGGALKICTVRPKVAEIFAMTNLQRHIEINPDEGASLASPWPERTSASRSAAIAGKSSPAVTQRPAEGEHSPPPSALQELRPIRLIVEVGRAKGQAIEVKGAKFVIGRDPRCQLRPSSELISRLHAVIEQREGRVFVRDLGTKNGTIVNERVLHGQEVEVSNGDRVQVGLLEFSLSIGDRPGHATPTPAPPKAEDEALAYLLGEKGQIDPDASTLYFLPTAKAGGSGGKTPASSPEEEAAAKLAEMAKGLRHLKLDNAGDALVVTILTPDIADEATVAPVRYDLQTLLDRVHPHKLLVSLSQVQSLSQRAVGVLLAISQRVERAGGTLRICDADPELMPALEASRLTELTDLYPTREEALAVPWT
jgi:anti-anti-sigma factor